MRFYDLVRHLHILAGAAALLTFWATAALRKGSGRHRATGKVYLSSMLLVTLTAVPLAAAAFLAGQPVQGTFLTLLVVLTATVCWLTWRAVRDKASYARFTGGVFRVLAGLNVAGGALVLVLGIDSREPILAAFALVGLLAGGGMLRQISRPPADRRWWIVEHYGAAVGCGIATHIAFLSLGLTRLVPAEWAAVVQPVAWFGPVAAAVVARAWLDRRYGRKATARSARALAPQSSPYFE